MEPDFLPDPAHGRMFTTTRAVRSTDVTPAGRLRFDALARYLQDAAEDDVAGTGWDAPYGWLLRRCTVTVRGYPVRGEQVGLRTFCSATGPRWAAAEDVLAGAGRPPASAELEYHRAVLPGHQPRLASAQSGDQVWLWLLDGPHRLASARLAFSG